MIVINTNTNTTNDNELETLENCCRNEEEDGCAVVGGGDMVNICNCVCDGNMFVSTMIGDGDEEEGDTAVVAANKKKKKKKQKMVVELYNVEVDMNGWRALGDLMKRKERGGGGIEKLILSQIRCRCDGIMFATTRASSSASASASESAFVATDCGLACIAEGLEHNTTLTSLVYENEEEALLLGRTTAATLDDNSHHNDDGLDVVTTVGIDASLAIGKMLQVNRTLQELRLNGCRINNDCCRAICNGLEHNGTLAVLDLVWNDITEVTALARVLQNNNHPSLTELYLGFNRIGDEGCRILCRALQQEGNNNTARLCLLDLRCNDITDDACDAIGQMLLFQATNNNNNNNSNNHHISSSALQRLDLEFNAIREKGLQRIAMGLQHNRNVTSIQLDHHSERIDFYLTLNQLFASPALSRLLDPTPNTISTHIWLDALLSIPKQQRHGNSTNQRGGERREDQVKGSSSSSFSFGSKRKDKVGISCYYYILSLQPNLCDLYHF